MQIICEKFKKEDEEFLKIKNDFKNVYVAAQYTLKDEETKLKEIKGNYDKAKGNFDIVERSLEGAPPDPYCEKTKEFMTQAAKNLEEMEKKLDHIKQTYAG